MKNISVTVSFFAFLILLLVASPASFAASKYCPDVVTLRQDHSYIKKSAAPDYWALSPYYVHQISGSGCGVATLTPVLNAARDARSLTSADALITQKNIHDVLKDQEFKKAVEDKGGGVTLDRLGEVVLNAFQTFKLKNPKVRVEHISDVTLKTKKMVVEALKKNEITAKNFILVNFFQGTFTCDPEGVGHMSAVGAYDAKKHRVLILDVDREWYEPYWVSVDALIKGMNTIDTSVNLHRGFVMVSFE